MYACALSVGPLQRTTIREPSRNILDALLELGGDLSRVNVVGNDFVAIAGALPACALIMPLKIVSFRYSSPPHTIGTPYIPARAVPVAGCLSVMKLWGMRPTKKAVSQRTNVSYVVMQQARGIGGCGRTS